MSNTTFPLPPPPTTTYLPVKITIEGMAKTGQLAIAYLVTTLLQDCGVEVRIDGPQAELQIQELRSFRNGRTLGQVQRRLAGCTVQLDLRQLPRTLPMEDCTSTAEGQIQKPDGTAAHNTVTEWPATEPCPVCGLLAHAADCR